MDERTNLISSNSTNRLINTARVPPLEEQPEPNEVHLRTNSSSNHFPIQREQHPFLQDIFLPKNPKGNPYFVLQIKSFERVEIFANILLLLSIYFINNREDYLFKRFSHFRYSVATALHMLKAFVSLLFDFW